MRVNRCCRRARHLPEAFGMHSGSGEPGRPQREAGPPSSSPLFGGGDCGAKRGSHSLEATQHQSCTCPWGSGPRMGRGVWGGERGEEAFLGEGQDCFASGHPGPGGALRLEPWALLQLLCRLWCPGPWLPWAQAPDEPLSSPMSVSLTAA